MVLLMRAQPMKIMRTRDYHANRRENTFVKDRFHSKGLVIREGTRHVVGFCVADHEMKVCFKPKALLVHPSLQLRVHSTDVHRIFNDLKIAVTTISLSVERIARASILGCTISDWVDRLQKQIRVFTRLQLLQGRSTRFEIKGCHSTALCLRYGFRIFIFCFYLQLRSNRGLRCSPLFSNGRFPSDWSVERRCTSSLHMCGGNETDLRCDRRRHRRVPCTTGFDGPRRLRRDGDLDKR
jgi:hypothetical protein